MNYLSTRGSKKTLTISQAMKAGLADDGGLYLPQQLPSLDLRIADKNLAEFAHDLLLPFFKNDAIEGKLKHICDSAFNFDIKLDFNKDNCYLELFHGPTNAFKDFGARFLAGCLSEIQNIAHEKLTIMVATSGDTGGAVAAAFYKKENIQVFLLFPKGKVSRRQEAQLTCWGENIHSFRVDGTFDDCQKMVKDAFSNGTIQEKFQLTSANSINIGRILPQMSYSYYASEKFKQKTGQLANIIVPSGNLGNIFGIYLAKKLGAPIGKIIMGTNNNQVMPDFFKTGNFSPRQSIVTLANAMDVGNPSNFERLRHYLPKNSDFKSTFNCHSVTDEQIKETISTVFTETKKVICPHTAVAEFIRRKFYSNLACMVYSTAHPAKFEEIVGPLLGCDINTPENLENIYESKKYFKNIGPSLEDLLKNLV